jgi:hypothetical protein
MPGHNGPGKRKCNMNSVSRRKADCKPVPSADDSTRRALVVVPPKPDKKPEPEAKDFDWNADDSIILREQPETAIYYNPEGSLVIRQRGWPDEDVIIIIAEQSIDQFLDKLTDACGVPSVGKP